MQARSSSDGKIYTWHSGSADFAGVDYAGPGAPQEIAVLQKPMGGVRVVGQVVIDTVTVPPSSLGVVVATLGLATSPGRALVTLSSRFQLTPSLPAPAGIWGAAQIRMDVAPITPSREFGFYPTPYTVILPIEFTVPITIPDAGFHSYTVTIDTDSNTTALFADTPGLFTILL